MQKFFNRLRESADSICKCTTTKALSDIKHAVQPPRVTACLLLCVFPFLTFPVSLQFSIQSGLEKSASAVASLSDGGKFHPARPRANSIQMAAGRRGVGGEEFAVPRAKSRVGADQQQEIVFAHEGGEGFATEIPGPDILVVVGGADTPGGGVGLQRCQFEAAHVQFPADAVLHQDVDLLLRSGQGGYLGFCKQALELHPHGRRRCRGTIEERHGIGRCQLDHGEDTDAGRHQAEIPLPGRRGRTELQTGIGNHCPGQKIEPGITVVGGQPDRLVRGEAVQVEEQ